MVASAFCRSHVWRVLQLGIHLWCDYFYASFHCKWPFTRYIFWWSLDYFRLLYARLYETICCTRYTTFELSGREDSFVFGRLYQSLIFLRFAFCGLLFDVSANALSRFFVLIIDLIPFYSIFFNSLERKWGRADFAERPCRRTYTQSVSRQRYVLWYRKACIIFENPYPTALATSFFNHRIFAFRWNTWNPFVSCDFGYCICSLCLYSHCIRVCVENFQVYKVTMSDLYQAKWPGDNWSDNSNNYFDFFYL